MNIIQWDINLSILPLLKYFTPTVELAQIVHLAQYSIEMSIEMEFFVWKIILPVFFILHGKKQKMPFENCKDETLTL